MDKTRASNAGTPSGAGGEGGQAAEAKEVKTEQPKSTPSMEVGSVKQKEGVDETPKEVVTPG